MDKASADKAKTELFTQGYTIVPFLQEPSSYGIGPLLSTEDWPTLDALLGKLLLPQGPLRNFLSDFLPFTLTEYLISIRGRDPDEEDGIWHDDGSRNLAFSLSLNLEASHIQGGMLEFKRKDQAQLHSIPTPPFGSMILFLTGTHGFEHRIRKVDRGRRIMAIGWCT